jgi:hypothetical protein
VSLFNVLRVFAARPVPCLQALLMLIAFLEVVAGPSPRLFAQVKQVPVWTELSPSGPPVRYDMAMAYDGAAGQAVRGTCISPAQVIA